jgi:hypothetical protein
MPPDKKTAPPVSRGRPHSSSSPVPATTTKQKPADSYSTTNRRQCAADTVAGLHRRRQASPRLVPMACGCPDPWPCCCRQPPLSDRTLEAWADTVAHLRSHGLTPIVPPAVRQALNDYILVGGDD